MFLDGSIRSNISWNKNIMHVECWQIKAKTNTDNVKQLSDTCHVLPFIHKALVRFATVFKSILRHFCNI